MYVVNIYEQCDIFHKCAASSDLNDIRNIIPVLTPQANIFICFINIQTDQLNY